MNAAAPRRALLALAALAGLGAAQDPRIAKVEELLRRYDVDGDGRVVAAEAKGSNLLKRCDKDGDGVATAAEILAAEGGVLDLIARRRLLVDLPDAANFDAVPAFDADGDGALDLDELKCLVFASCDREPKDRALSLKEAARSPAPSDGATKVGWLTKEFKRLDRNGDGALLMRDLELPEGWLRGLDRDGDGRASFDELAADEVRRLGGYVAKYAEAAKLLAERDALRASDWPGDAPLFRRLDEDKDSRVTPAELDRYVRSLRAALAIAAPFALRFDLDGDGRVARVEFPGSDLVFARLDADGDGFADVPPRR